MSTMATLTDGLACIWAIWSCAVLVVQGLGTIQIFRRYAKPPARAVVETLPDKDIPHVTIIRPVKGLEPMLYECIASTFRQTYPPARLSVHLCVESRADPAVPVLERVLADYPAVDARLYVEAEDPLLHGAHGHVHNLGPNPKIRNISRAYREARGDVVWIVDCNVWVAAGVAGRMVDKLYGFQREGGGMRRVTPYKFVHQLPLVVDVTPPAREPPSFSALLERGGARLDEMFMATTHAKFYSAINTVGIAPCVVGKSNMFRRPMLDRLTDPAANPTVLTAADSARGRGVDFFSSYICEDHLIGDLFFRSPVPGYYNHGLVPADLAIQPMANNSVRAYMARRVRWLRVRKWTVLLATLVEPGVESLLCCFYASFAVTTLIPRFLPRWPSALATVASALAIESTWAAVLRGWVVGIAVWMAVDRVLYRQLHAGQTIPVPDLSESSSDPATVAAAAVALPSFVRGQQRANGVPPRAFLPWLTAWVGREVLALPIWTWAVLLGATVDWRGKRFLVRMDMSVSELVKPEEHATRAGGAACGNGKARLD